MEAQTIYFNDNHFNTLPLRLGHSTGSVEELPKKKCQSAVSQLYFPQEITLFTSMGIIKKQTNKNLF